MFINYEHCSHMFNIFNNKYCFKYDLIMFKEVILYLNKYDIVSK
jgi:hypothetical protein